jgi:Cu/Ag efflux protein CusF
MIAPARSKRANFARAAATGAALLALAVAVHDAAGTPVGRSVQPLLLAQAEMPLADGEVRRVDKDAGKITLKHGEIKHLDMPPMTMVFRVSDPAMLDRVKAGDRVRFATEKVGGQYTIMKIERVE